MYKLLSNDYQEIRRWFNEIFFLYQSDIFIINDFSPCLSIDLVLIGLKIFFIWNKNIKKYFIWINYIIYIFYKSIWISFWSCIEWSGIKNIIQKKWENIFYLLVFSTKFIKKKLSLIKILNFNRKLYIEILNHQIYLRLEFEEIFLTD